MWTAIASTASVSARDNTSTNPSVNPTGVPIYNLGNSLVAPTYSSLWSGFLNAPIDVTEHGVRNDSLEPWTGTQDNGFSFVPLGNGYSIVGTSDADGQDWIDWTTMTDEFNFEPLYALSGILTVPAPEPSTMVLAILAAAGLAAMRRRSRST